MLESNKMYRYKFVANVDTYKSVISLYPNSKILDYINHHKDILVYIISTDVNIYFDFIDPDTAEIVNFSKNQNALLCDSRGDLLWCDNTLAQFIGPYEEIESTTVQSISSVKQAKCPLCGYTGKEGFVNFYCWNPGCDNYCP